jgi:hypothetical protein
MFRRTKQASERIAGVFASFENMIAELELGIEESEAQLQTNALTIHALHEESKDVRAQAEKARTLAESIGKLLGK